MSTRHAGLIQSGRYQSLTKRHLTEETCRFWRYWVATYNGTQVQVANYIRDNEVVAQKVRFPDKNFILLGDTKGLPLYGQWLWRDGGRYLTIVEGEVDALSVSQVQDHKWPVVSIPNGAQSAERAVKDNLEWVLRFDTIVLMFDMDAPGQVAAKRVAELLPPGRCKIASLPLKDANELLQAGRGSEIVKAFWEAKTHRPDGLVAGVDTWDIVTETKSVHSVNYPWACCQEKTHGLRVGEIVTLAAGSGIGKSTIARELAYHLVLAGERVGYIGLEESVRQSALNFMSLAAGKRLHLIEDTPREELRKYWEATLGTGRIYLYDHWGSTEVENLMSKVRYLVRGYDCRYVFLDHLSIVVSGLEGDNERRLIDQTMTELRTLVEETQCGLVLVSHLKRPDGKKGHEEGAVTSLSHLRGSHAIAQLSDIVIGVERDQQGEQADVTTVRVLKNRFSGDTGIAGHLAYNKDTGRLSEVDPSVFDDNTEEAF